MSILRTDPFTDQTHWWLDHPGLRWTRLDSVVVTGPGPQMEIMIWNLRPIRTSAKNWSREFSNEYRAAVGQGAWIARGLTEVCFWTAPNLLSSELESRSRCLAHSSRLD